MAQVPIEGLLDRCESLYRLVLLAAKRAKAVSEGSPKLVETRERKAISIALEEILQGKVFYKPTESEEGSSSKKKGRSTKGKAAKKKAA